MPAVAGDCDEFATSVSRSMCQHAHDGRYQVLLYFHPLPIISMHSWTALKATLAQGVNSVTAELEVVEKLADQVTWTRLPHLMLASFCPTQPS